MNHARSYRKEKQVTRLLRQYTSYQMTRHIIDLRKITLPRRTEGISTYTRTSRDQLDAVTSPSWETIQTNQGSAFWFDEVHREDNRKMQNRKHFWSLCANLLLLTHYVNLDNPRMFFSKSENERIAKCRSIISRNINQGLSLNKRTGEASYKAWTQMLSCFDDIKVVGVEGYWLKILHNRRSI